MYVALPDNAIEGHSDRPSLSLKFDGGSKKAGLVFKPLLRKIIKKLKDKRSYS